jgi:hypothetical protein
VPAEDEPLVGGELAGRYMIEAVLGEGGLGRVYRARHKRMSRRYAIKVPYGELTHDARARARFLREADVVGRLEHPAVVAATDVGETEEGLLYLAMDLAEGFGLDVVLEAGPMPGHRIPNLIDQLLSGLAHAHERGIVHRDLKPANVIVDRDVVRIVDFGIAALADEQSGAQPRLTTVGTIMGTPNYMAPEQLSAAAVDARADLFSLGVMLYEMLSGKLPFDGAPMEIAAMNTCSDVPRIAARAPEAGPVDPLIEALARWLMERDPVNRPQRAGDALKVLRLVREDRAAAAQALAPWMERERAVAAAEEARDSRETTRISGREALVVREAGIASGKMRSRVWMLGVAVVPVVLLGVWWAQMRETGTGTQTETGTETETETETETGTGTGTETQTEAQTETGTETGTEAQTETETETETRTETRAQRKGKQEKKTEAVVPATGSSFAARYRAVGEALAAHGDGAIEDLMTRYRAIAYLDAVRQPDKREAAMKELDAIARALAKRSTARP